MRLGLELIVIGSGGHAKVVISSLLPAAGEVHAMYDDDSKKWNQSSWGFPISGPIDRLDEPDACPPLLPSATLEFAQQIVERYQRDWMPVIHPPRRGRCYSKSRRSERWYLREQ